MLVRSNDSIGYCSWLFQHSYFIQFSMLGWQYKSYYAFMYCKVGNYVVFFFWMQEQCPCQHTYAHLCCSEDQSSVHKATTATTYNGGFRTIKTEWYSRSGMLFLLH